MNIQITPSWVLTTDHALSSYGKPVLVNRTSGDGYGPSDVHDFTPGAGGMQPAAAFVARFAARTTGADREAVKAFLSQWPEGPQLS